MDDKVLSQEEVEALLETVEEPEAGDANLQGASEQGASSSETATGPGDDDAERSRVFPLLRNQELSDVLASTVNMVHESFAYSIASTLSVTLRAQTHFNLHSVDGITYGEFIGKLPEPCSVWALRLDRLNTHVVLCFQPELVHSVVDCLMGGAGSAPKQRDAITELDQSVVAAAVDIFCDELSKAWSRVLELELSVASYETRPGFLNICSPAEPIVQVTMSMALFDTEARFFLGFPSPVINELSSRLDHQSHTEDPVEESVNHIKALIMEIPTAVEVCLTPTTITAGDLVRIRPGDVIDFDHGLEQPVCIKVNGVGKLEGKIMASNRKRIVEIV